MNKAQRTQEFDFSTTENLKNSCANYIGERYSTYEFRSIRYEAVLEFLKTLGIKDGDSVADVGGANGEFGKYLSEQQLNVEYKVIDGMVDGTDLNKWTPEQEYDFMVSIEVIEHLHSPDNFLKTLDENSKKGVVLTTPNPHVTDVKAMDATHISEVYPSDFYRAGYKVFPAILFFESEDSLVAIKDKRSMIGL